uniref:Putative secreted protein n=1 Tax=Ixodes ricinus TaxID=34613 RepID=A0A6B0UL09_IXORI
MFCKGSVATSFLSSFSCSLIFNPWLLITNVTRAIHNGPQNPTTRFRFQSLTCALYGRWQRYHYCSAIFRALCCSFRIFTTINLYCPPSKKKKELTSSSTGIGNMATLPQCRGPF